MKKYLVLVLTFTLLLALIAFASCKSENEGEVGTQAGTTTEEVTTKAPFTPVTKDPNSETEGTPTTDDNTQTTTPPVPVAQNPGEGEIVGWEDGANA